MYSVQALWTAAQQRVPLTVVVLNNRGYGAVKALGLRIGMDTVPGTGLPGLDPVTLARGFGCPGRAVTAAAELGDALTEALTHDGPFLLDVNVAPDDSPAYES